MESKYFYKKHNQKFGPYSADEIVKLIDDTTLVCNIQNGDNEWLPAGNILELNSLIHNSDKKGEEIDASRINVELDKKTGQGKYKKTSFVALSIIVLIFFGIVAFILYTKEQSSVGKRQEEVSSIAVKPRLYNAYVKGVLASGDVKPIISQISSTLSFGSGWLITPTDCSPINMECIRKFIYKFQNIKYNVTDDVDYSTMLMANELSYGKRALPVYMLNRARTVVAINWDFLHDTIYPFQTISNLTGLDYKHGYELIDVHFPQTKPSEYARGNLEIDSSLLVHFVLNIYYKINKDALIPMENKYIDYINEIVTKLSKGRGLLLCHYNNKDLQVVVNAINHKIGADGQTIDHFHSLNAFVGIDNNLSEIQQWVKSESKKNAKIIVYDPAFDSKNSKYNFLLNPGVFEEKILITAYYDIDAVKYFDYILPVSLASENYSCAELVTSYFSIQPKPNIRYDSALPMSIGGYLLALSGQKESYDDFFLEYWKTNLGGEENLKGAFNLGYVTPAGEFATESVSFNEEQLGISLQRLKH